MNQGVDLVVRNGLVVDGSGAAAREQDICINNGRIVDIGVIHQSGREEIDAKGKIVTPGFVDIHTHYDGQATWDSRLMPSSTHGVTTVIMGNCGVGFAPCKPTDRDVLIELMDGIEDIPDSVLRAGLSWNWETFPEYLEFLGKRQFDVDVAAYVPHAALRVYAMGLRGAACEPATPTDIAMMAQLLKDSINAGAIGFGTSRVIFHQTRKGKPIPTLKTSTDELMGLCTAMGAKGILQYVGDYKDPEREFAELRKLATETGCRIILTVLAEDKEMMDRARGAHAAGLPIKVQMLPRPVGFLLGYELTLHPFYATEPYQMLATLPLPARIAELRKPEVRAAILSAPFRPNANSLGTQVRDFGRMFSLGDPPNYEPAASESISSRAQKVGISPEELAYDLMLEDDGHAFLYCAAANYNAMSLTPHRNALAEPFVVAGLGDGGAHCKTLCDASYTTFMLTHWSRDRSREKIPLEQVVRYMTSDAANVVGFTDRGRIAIGQRADLNVIDMDRLKLHRPQLTHDLPSGGARLLQAADGYECTLVNGVVTYREGHSTGRLPGRLAHRPPGRWG